MSQLRYLLAMVLALVLTLPVFAAAADSTDQTGADKPPVVRVAANDKQGTATVNVNTATVEQLQQLKGIGKKKAADIIAYRQKNGDFKSWDDLKKVKGIGDKMAQRLSSRITFN